MKTKGVFSAAILMEVLCISGNLLAYSGDGDGSAGNPYQIANVADFNQLTLDPNNWNKAFILTADINLTGRTFAHAPISGDMDNTNAGEFQGTKFTGIFNGNSHTIFNLTITASTQDYIGLFGYVDSGGQIRNLGVEDVNITGNFSVGGLVGLNSGTLTACYATGSVSGTYTSGGLVGENSGTLTACYATGSVSGPNPVGGLVGFNINGTLTGCYASGSVSGGSPAGGLVGQNLFSSLTSCYATGSVSGGGYVGGLMGMNGGTGTLTGCFWDIQTSGQTTSAGGTGKTTAEMKTLSTFTSAGWDFVNSWGIVQNQTYPYLRTQPSADLNSDGVVDMIDFAIFAAQWLERI